MHLSAFQLRSVVYTLMILTSLPSPALGKFDKLFASLTNYWNRFWDPTIGTNSAADYSHSPVWIVVNPGGGADSNAGPYTHLSQHTNQQPSHPSKWKTTNPIGNPHAEWPLNLHNKSSDHPQQGPFIPEKPFPRPPPPPPPRQTAGGISTGMLIPQQEISPGKTVPFHTKIPSSSGQWSSLKPSALPTVQLNQPLIDLRQPIDNVRLSNSPPKRLTQNIVPVPYPILINPATYWSGHLPSFHASTIDPIATYYTSWSTVQPQTNPGKNVAALAADTVSHSFKTNEGFGGLPGNIHAHLTLNYVPPPKVTGSKAVTSKVVNLSTTSPQIFKKETSLVETTSKPLTTSVPAKLDSTFSDSTKSILTTNQNVGANEKGPSMSSTTTEKNLPSEISVIDPNKSSNKRNIPAWFTISNGTRMKRSVEKRVGKENNDANKEKNE